MAWFMARRTSTLVLGSLGSYRSSKYCPPMPIQTMKAGRGALRDGVTGVDDFALEFPGYLGDVGFPGAEHGHPGQVFLSEEEGEGVEVRIDAPVFVKARSYLSFAPCW